ncbi:MAG TPA: TetR/AcrR family transcriptional regulator [Planktothrix sp.]|jgi:AcrR family transcriptional regulator
MARPRADDYELKRQSILDKAAVLFAAQGFASTSIASIALYCNVSKSLLYHYYDSKEALLFDMLKTHCALLVETAKEAVNESEKPEEQLSKLIHSLLSIYMSSRDKHVILLNDLHCLPKEQQDEVRDLERAVVRAFKEIVGKLKPQMGADELSATAMYLMGAINWTYTWFKPDGRLSEERFADMSTTLFLSGITQS